MEDQLKKLFEGSRLRQFPRGQILLYEGDQVVDLFYIVEGYVKVYNILEAGTESIIFIYGPGDIFPFTSYLTAGVVRYFYECMTNCQLRASSVKSIESTIKNQLELGEALIRYTDMVNQQFLRRIDVLSVNSARRKVIAMLAFLVDKAGSPESPSRVGIPLTTQDISELCGLTRETTSTQLVNLRQSGVLSGNRHLLIDRQKLAKLKPPLAITH